MADTRCHFLLLSIADAGWPGGGPNACPSLRDGCPAMLGNRGKSANSARVRASDSADLARKARRPRLPALLGCASTGHRLATPHRLKNRRAPRSHRRSTVHNPGFRKAVGVRRAQRLCGAEQRSRSGRRAQRADFALSEARTRAEFAKSPAEASSAGESTRSGDRRSEAEPGARPRLCALRTEDCRLR